MSRARRATDWVADLTRAKAAEEELAAVLASDSRLDDFEDRTADFDKLDFAFTYGGVHVQVDLKEKRSRYSPEVAALWPEVAPEDLFIIDETVYRRIVWQGGGGYLLVHDHPMERWAVFGPWELTLGPRVRYARWGRLTGDSFRKGKLLLDLRCAARQRRSFSVDDLLYVVHEANRARDQVEPVEVRDHAVPTTGTP